MDARDVCAAVGGDGLGGVTGEVPVFVRSRDRADVEPKVYMVSSGQRWRGSSGLDSRLATNTISAGIGRNYTESAKPLVGVAEQVERHLVHELRGTVLVRQRRRDICQKGRVGVELRAETTDTIAQFRRLAGAECTPPLVCYSARREDGDVSPGPVVRVLKVTEGVVRCVETKIVVSTPYVLEEGVEEAVRHASVRQ